MFNNWLAWLGFGWSVWVENGDIIEGETFYQPFMRENKYTRFKEYKNVPVNWHQGWSKWEKISESNVTEYFPYDGGYWRTGRKANYQRINKYNGKVEHTSNWICFPD